MGTGVERWYNRNMPVLIDGYNLLHVSGVFGTGTALTELHRSREALLAFLASSLEPAARSTTTIVFDAAGAPPGLPQRFAYEGIDVQFARDPGNADELLERLIAAHAAPRTLVVVSGDHRVPRGGGERRRSTAIVGGPSCVRNAGRREPACRNLRKSQRRISRRERLSIGWGSLQTLQKRRSSDPRKN
jgi:predicted RNA-binding protein with PIN domain